MPTSTAGITRPFWSDDGTGPRSREWAPARRAHVLRHRGIDRHAVADNPHRSSVPARGPLARAAPQWWARPAARHPAFPRDVSVVAARSAAVRTRGLPAPATSVVVADDARVHGGRAAAGRALLSGVDQRSGGCAVV